MRGGGERATSRDATAPFPTTGVLLVATVMGVGLVRELSSGPTNHTRPVALLVGVMLDTAFLVWIAPRVDRRVTTPAQATVTTLAINAVVSIAYWLAIRVLLMLVHPGEPARFTAAAGAGVLWSFEVFALWAVGFRHPMLARTAHLRELEAARLREQAELIRLRAHLQPHFLRNTLNTVSALVTEDPRQARRLIAALGDLLTDELTSDAPARSLDDEIAWLKRYADIIEMRHRGAITFEWDVDPALAGTYIPTLLLQPLVENAVMHGALVRDGGGRVTVRAYKRDGGGMCISVEDNGPGIGNASSVTEGVGLRVVRGRLASEHRGATLDFPEISEGTRVVLELP